MPAHFTHIYTARRVAEYLTAGEVPEWPEEGSDAWRHDAKTCGQIMTEWEKFTAIGAIGPDIFMFSQDYNNKLAGPRSDFIMLTLAVYYFFDEAKEEDWEPLLLILDQVNSTMAAFVRFLIKLQKAWQSFLDGWNATIGPIVADINNLGDALTGGVLSEFGVVLKELKLALETLGEQELLTFHDIFGMFNTCIQKGYEEKLFLWSDMSHYRRPSALCQAFVREAERLAHEGEMNQHGEQFLAFAMGYMTHLGTDTVAHSFVNEQCGGPFRNHPQRHHLIETQMDAWNYRATRPGRGLTPDPWGWSDTYPDICMSALWFLVQMTPEEDDPEGPHGVQRPDPLPDDPVARKKALDVDGEMPDWMAESIVRAMIDCFSDGEHPQIFQGKDFQSKIEDNYLTDAIELVTGAGPDRPLPELLDDIAPQPSFEVPVGFPLPWEVKTIYKVLYSFYRISYNGTWSMEKPRKPDFVIVPPPSDVSNLLQPPDLSGIDPSDPVDDICGSFVALFDWAIKSIGAAVQLVEDLIKMLVSPSTYAVRLALYELAMMVWDIVMKTHEVLAHTGLLSPHAEQVYKNNGELRLPNEIDEPLVTLGGTVDSAFRAALAAAFDPFAFLDKDQDVIGTDHLVSDKNYPYYPVLLYHVEERTRDGEPFKTFEEVEYKRPWAWPSESWQQVPSAKPVTTATPTEKYDPSFCTPSLDPGVTYEPLRPGPYPLGTQPDRLFKVNEPVEEKVRHAYEHAQTPWETDRLNATYLSPERLGSSPLGDPIPFSAYLIGQLANDTGYSTQFNLDSDRAYAYLTWDWIRNPLGTDTAPDTGPLGPLTTDYRTPEIPPEGDPRNDHNYNGLHWDAKTPLRLDYADKPTP